MINMGYNFRWIKEIRYKDKILDAGESEYLNWLQVWPELMQILSDGRELTGKGKFKMRKFRRSWELLKNLPTMQQE
jgi:hypothetical protein